MTLPDGSVQIVPLRGIAEVRPGDDLAAVILDALSAAGDAPRDGDILVVTQKIVSKAEGRLVDLRSVAPSVLATEWAARWDKDPRVVELALRESARIVRMANGIIIAETRHGFVCANAGVDASNVAPDTAALLPLDPDASAARLRLALRERTGAVVGVVISDTFGRAWREGQTDVAIGVAGLPPVRSYAGQVDPTGYELRVTEIAVADELAGAAELVMGKLDGVPVALVRGLGHLLPAPGDGPTSARQLIRPADRDLFR